MVERLGVGPLRHGLGIARRDRRLLAPSNTRAPGSRALARVRLVAGHPDALEWIAVVVGLVPASVDVACDGSDAEVGVLVGVVLGDRVAGVGDVDAVVAVLVGMVL